MPAAHASGVTVARKGFVVGVFASSAIALPNTTSHHVELQAWSQRATRVCSQALLFDHRHRMGTLQGAQAVARDIRRSTGLRLAKLRPVGLSGKARRQVARWLAMERELAAMYARSYVRIFEVIAAARTAKERARMPVILLRLVHAPDRLRAAAARLDATLRVPDCTGGGEGRPALGS